MYVYAHAHRQDELQQNHATRECWSPIFAFCAPKPPHACWKFKSLHTKIIHVFCCGPEINGGRGWHVNVSSAQIEQTHISLDDKSGRIS